MNGKRHLIIGLACGVACAACIVLAFQDMQEQALAERNEALARYGGEQIEVCVAKRTIAAGEKVAKNDIETKLWVADLLPPDAVQSSDDVVGKQASSAILSGEVISMQRFGDTKLQLDVPEGYSAVSLPARDVQALGGALYPGMKVDVYATGSTSTKCILRNVQVLATNSDDSSSSSSLSWVTVAVSPKNVQEAVTAAQTMDIYFALPETDSQSNSQATTSRS